jgi:type I restriction enzyme M protein
MRPVSNLGNFVWSIADQLRGVYKPHQYGDVILPMTILRRLDCILEPTRNDVRALAAKTDQAKALDAMVRQKFKLNFYNTSEYDFAKLKTDPEGLRDNLIDYVSRFSANIDVFEKFKFENEIDTMAGANRLFLVVEKFADVDLHPDVISNADMGDLFEELIRKFAEASNETAGEHFTPRDAIRLMVDLLFAEDNDALLEKGVVRSVYDPTAGTGGMLSVAEEHLLAQNPDARLTMYGQELNPQSYAICKSDMIAKGQDATNIREGDTLANDHFAGRSFDYCLSNPPYGYDWKASEAAVKAERQATGKAGRFGAGLPKIGDGQMLFLSHLAHKMRAVNEGGGRAGIVLNGSPLFTGAAESGESEIRRWLLESDLVDAIVALPTNMFYNTGISTYVWILDNNKRSDRVGKVQLLDGTGFFSKLRKNLGAKSREIQDGDRAKLVKLYADFKETEHSKIFDAVDFGYWSITVDRPLRLNFSCAAERIDAALRAKTLADVDSALLRDALTSLGDRVYLNRDTFLADLRPALRAAGLKLSAPLLKTLWLGLGQRDPTADACRNPKGDLEPDMTLRDVETVPFGFGGTASMSEALQAYFAVEIEPNLTDAWIDHTKTKIGYEVPFTRQFYKYVAPRPLETIDADLDLLVKEIIGLLQEIES